jgi:hypothetical protein
MPADAPIATRLWSRRQHAGTLSLRRSRPIFKEREGNPAFAAARVAALLLTALVALLVPTNRAAATDPLQALRYD